MKRRRRGGGTRSDVIHFLDINEQLSRGGASPNHQRSGAAVGSGSLLSFTAHRMNMLHALIDTMSTIWCDLYEMMEVRRNLFFKYFFTFLIRSF